MSGQKDRTTMLQTLFDPTRVAPATVTELADVTGLSAWTIRRDIEAGELRAVRRRLRGSSSYRIVLDDARRYLRQLGLPPAP